MAPTPVVTPTERFFSVEISKVYILTAVADLAVGATRAELTAGKDITNEIAAISGFSVTSGTIDVPDLGARFTKKIGGRTTVEDSSLTVYASLTGDDLRTDLPRGTKGFAAFCDQGDEVGLPYDLYPFEVTSVGKVRSVDEQGFQLTIGFAITGVPAEDLLLPATV